MTLPVPINSALLPADEWATLLAMSPELAHAYAKRQIFRTETEARVSVLNDLHFPTPASKYWQAVREQTVMLEQLALLSFEWRRNELAIKRHEIALAAASGLKSDEIRIDLDECLFRRANMLTVAADRMRELKMWSMLKAEQGEDFDRSDVNAHQLVSYTTQFCLRAAHADAAKMSGGEMDNLVGQLRTSIARAKQTGVLDQVQSALPNEARQQLEAVT